jgi:hypothetical protein
MAGNQIEQDADTLFVGLLKEPAEIAVGPVTGGNLFIVAHIVPRVLERRIKTGIDPQGVESQIPNKPKFLDDPLDIAYPVPIGIVIGLGIDFVKHRVFQP